MYDSYGAVWRPGTYVFLQKGDGDSFEMVTTYEGLRDGSATGLTIHKSDASDTSRAGVYDAVQVGDIFEWRYADDCFVRYQVQEVQNDPTGGPPAKVLDVKAMTYAYTGCSGTISASAEVHMTWGDLPDLGGVSLAAPIVHGIYQIIPPGWRGEIVELVLDFSGPGQPGVYRSYSTLAEARLLPYWRDPALPEGWVLQDARIGFEGRRNGYCATFLTEERTRRRNEVRDEVYRDSAFHLCGLSITEWYRPQEAFDRNSVTETRVLAGRPAVVTYGRSSHYRISILVYDPETESEYEFRADDSSIGGSNPEPALTIVRGLFDEPSDPDTTTLRYDAYDLTGAVEAPGSYAFLADADDPSTAVTTYEGLRDGSATALLIHTTDADGVSRADVYDAVEAGDLFEWRQADDCWVRYRVTNVPAAEAAAAYREFGVRWETYVFQGCQTDSLPTSALTVKFTAAAELPLEHLGGTNLTGFAVVHGVRQLVPVGVLSPSGEVLSGTAVAVEPARVRPLTPLAGSVPHIHTGDLAEARRLPYWREPRVPAGWRFAGARSGDSAGGLHGYTAGYVGPEGYLAVTIMGAYASMLPMPADASWTVNDTQWLIVRELRVIAGRPATVTYSPLGPKHHDGAFVNVEVYDVATGAGYIVYGRNGSLGLLGGPAAAERVIAIASSLFDEQPAAGE